MDRTTLDLMESSPDVHAGGDRPTEGGTLTRRAVHVALDADSYRTVIANADTDVTIAPVAHVLRLDDLATFAAHERGSRARVFGRFVPARNGGCHHLTIDGIEVTVAAGDDLLMRVAEAPADDKAVTRDRHGRVISAFAWWDALPSTPHVPARRHVPAHNRAAFPSAS